MTTARAFLLLVAMAAAAPAMAQTRSTEARRNAYGIGERAARAWNDGIVINRIGNQTFWSDGRSATHFAGVVIYNDGTVATQSGDRTIFGNGRSCAQFGATTLCD